MRRLRHCALESETTSGDTNMLESDTSFPERKAANLGICDEGRLKRLRSDIGIKPVSCAEAMSARVI